MAVGGAGLRCGNRLVPDKRGLSDWEFLELTIRSRLSAYADVAHHTSSIMREVDCPRYRHLYEFTIKKGMSQGDPRRVVIEIGIWEEQLVAPTEKREGGKLWMLVGPTSDYG